jgi:hypothetical protein
MDLLPPPSALIQDDPAAADPARRKIAPKSRLSRLFAFRSSPNLRRVSSQEEPPVLNVASLDVDSTPITLDSSTLEDVFTDRYEWAILYENQRGSVLLSLLSLSISSAFTASLSSLYPTTQAYRCCHLTPRPLLFRTPLSSSAQNNLPFLLTDTLFQMAIGVGYPAAG